MENTTDRAPTPIPMGTNMSVNGGITTHTDRAPSPLPMGKNMSVNSGITKDTDRAPTPLPMEALRKASSRTVNLYPLVKLHPTRPNYL